MYFEFGLDLALAVVGAVLILCWILIVLFVINNIRTLSDEEWQNLSPMKARKKSYQRSFEKVLKKEPKLRNFSNV